DFAAGDVAAPGGVARGRPGQRTAAGPARAVPDQPGGAAAAAGVDAALPGVLAAAHRGTEGFSHGDGPMTEAAVEDDLMVECELDAAPGKVWRALTVPDFLTAWLLPGAGATL